MFFRLKRPIFAAAVCLFAVLTVLLMFYPDSSVKNASALLSEDTNTITVTGTVSAADSRYIYINSLSIITASSDIPCFITLKRKIRIVIPAGDFNTDFAIGNRIKLCGTFNAFSSATNPGEFDAASYYNDLHICGKITPENIAVTDSRKNYPGDLFYRLRIYLASRIDSVFPGKEASIIKDLLLGDRAGLDPDIKALYQRNGIAHILSVSSLHISLLGYGLFRLLRKAGAGNLPSAAISTIILVGYGMMTGFSTSAVRAVCIFVIAMGAKIVGRTTDSLTSLAVAALILAFSNPYCIRSCGFLLSFGSALGIYVFYPSLRRLTVPSDMGIILYKEKNAGLRFKKTFSKFLSGIGNSILSGFSITFTTLPVQLYFFYEIPTYSCLINPAVLPFLSFLMVSSLIALIPPLQIPASFVSCMILKWYEFLCGIFDRLPLSTWNPGCPRITLIIGFYVFWLIFVIALNSDNKGILKNKFSHIMPCLKNKKFGICKNISLKKVYIIIFSVASILLLVLFNLPHLKPGTAVFMDVGQGDCILVYTGGRDVYLFDGGSTSRTEVGKYVIKPVLKYYGLSVIDAVFISHTDSDHYNGICEILENRENWNIKVKRIYFPDMEGLTEETGYLELMNSIGYDAGDINIYCIKSGDSWQSGNTAFTCLHPPSGYSSEDINAASACFYVSFGTGGASLLLCGDVTGEGEENLTKALSGYPPVTVLKVAHHGSRNSSCDEFLSAADCSAAIISAGRNNMYGHPHAETLERLKKNNCSIYCTAKKGAVKVIFSGKMPQAKVSCFIKN